MTEIYPLSPTNIGKKGKRKNPDGKIIHFMIEDEIVHRQCDILAQAIEITPAKSTKSTPGAKAACAGWLGAFRRCYINR